MIGQTLSHFKITAKLGEGGMGEVYRATDTKLRREVAIKVLPGAFSRDQERLTRFKREAQVLAALDHPNIVHIYSVEEAEGIYFLTMQFLHGHTLAESIPTEGMPIDQILEIGSSLADGLAAAHARGIIHRDLKPTNIIVTREGRPKILDFGLAKLLEEAGGADSQMGTEMLTQEGTILGTVAYMSPEQAQAKPLDQRSDIFSLGVILYEMATGRHPFKSNNKVATLSAIVKDLPISVTELKPDLPGRMSAIISRALEKERERRFESAQDLRDALRAIRLEIERGDQAGEAVPALEQDSQRASASRELVSGPPLESLAILPLVNLSIDPDHGFFVDGMTDALIAELAQIGALRVISRTSIMRYKGSDKPLPEIARELDVERVMEGSVLRAGNRVRITVQLIQARTDCHLWANSYESELDDVLALQRNVALAVAQETRLILSSKERDRLERSDKVAAEAYEAYLLGRHHLNLRTTTDIETSVALFEQAIQLAPSYAPPYCGLADAFALLAGAGHAGVKQDLVGRARSAATRALKIDHDLAEAHTSLGFVRFKFDWDWNGAETAFQRAIQLSPSSASARHWYALYLSAARRHDEAQHHVASAQRLDPVSPIIRVAASRVLQFARDFDGALERARKALELRPNFAEGHFNLGLTHLYRREYRQATDALEKALVLAEGRTAFLAVLGHVHARAGRSQEARRILDSLRKPPHSGQLNSTQLAMVHLGLEEYDRCLDCLADAIQWREGLVVFLEAEPMADPLRTHPKYLACVQRLGLPRPHP